MICCTNQQLLLETLTALADESGGEYHGPLHAIADAVLAHAIAKLSPEDRQRFHDYQSGATYVAGGHTFPKVDMVEGQLLTLEVQGVCGSVPQLKEFLERHGAVQTNKPPRPVVEWPEAGPTERPTDAMKQMFEASAWTEKIARAAELHPPMYRFHAEQFRRELEELNSRSDAKMEKHAFYLQLQSHQKLAREERDLAEGRA